MSEKFKSKINEIVLEILTKCQNSGLTIEEVEYVPGYLNRKIREIVEHKKAETKFEV